MFLICKANRSVHYLSFFFFFPLPYISKKEVEVEDVALRKRNRLGDYKQAFCVWTLQDNGKFQVLSMIEAEN